MNLWSLDSLDISAQRELWELIYQFWAYFSWKYLYECIKQIFMDLEV